MLDLSRKIALGIELMNVPFVKSVLCKSRNNLILNKEQKRFFDLSLKHARTHGFFKSRNIQITLDTRPIFGRGAVEETYNMLAEALRLLISALSACARQSAEKTGLTVTTAIGDGTSGTIEARLDAQEAEIPYLLVARVAQTPRTGRFAKEGSPKNRHLPQNLRNTNRS